MATTNSLRLLQLVSQALPVGAYHYSQGIETAVEQGWIHDVATAEGWIRGVLESSVARVDVPVLFGIIWPVHLMRK